MLLFRAETYKTFSMKTQIRIALVLLAVLYFSCERLTQPRLGGGAFTLQEAATLVTESYLRLHAGQVVPGSTLRVYRNGEMLWQKPYTEADSIVYDSTLAPAHTYTYRAELWSGSRQLARSNAVTVTTLDTTNHDFEWEIIEFPSPYGSGALYDVAIINENDIWAVGEIYSDSNQTWLPYNAVHWDGEKWELKRINYKGSPWPITAIYAFSSDDVWFEAFVKWDGTNFIEMPIPDILIGYGINKIWGNSSKDFYVIGNRGFIAHYDGSSWQRMESGTDIDLINISGNRNIQNPVIWISGVSESYKYGVVLQIEKNRRVAKLFGDGKNIFGVQNSHTHPDAVWLDEEFGFISYAGINDSWLVRHRISSYATHYRVLHVEPQGAIWSIKGNGLNDWFAVGSRDVVLHYNGISVKKYFSWPTWDIRYFSVDVKGGLVVACGIVFTSPNAVILIGRRRKK